MESEIKILHLSDLHFTEGKDKSSPNHKHSISRLRGIEKFYTENNNYDRVIITGDLSNYGDKESLLTARGWIFNKLQIGEGDETGLHLSPSITRIVPGNHDAFNNEKSGTFTNRKQKSLEHYNFAFKDYYAMQPPHFAYYDWIEKSNMYIFMAFLDSCHLGDTQIENEDNKAMIFDKIARGNITIRQSEVLLEWYDKGMKGNLNIPNNNQECILKEKFAQSLKILVMHHYLFEPVEKKYDYFMSMSHRDVAIKNFAMSDFDILLCGHKHIPDFQSQQYGDHFNRRAKHRLLFNYFRRIIGIPSLPMQYSDENGKFFDRLISQFFNFLSLSVKDNTHDEVSESALVDLLNEFLEDPDKVESKLKKLIIDFQFKGKSEISSHELREIQKFINTSISQTKRQELKKIVSELNKIIKEFKHRPFLQLMAGSASKSVSDFSRERSFNDYTIKRDAAGYHIKSSRHDWDDDTKNFDKDGFSQEKEFTDTNKKKTSSFSNKILSKFPITLSFDK
ncbi:MAG: metallophosphoesterase [Ignavibacteriales bacterium]|nr:metallophosphoesterase [Ignavibacteriales bacterium]